MWSISGEKQKKFHRLFLCADASLTKSKDVAEIATNPREGKHPVRGTAVLTTNQCCCSLDNK